MKKQAIVKHIPDLATQLKFVQWPIIIFPPPKNMQIYP